MPVTIPATVIEVFHPWATVFLSKKKNAVAAKQPIDTSKNENPTKSSGCSMPSAWAIQGIPIKNGKVNKIIFTLF